MEFATELWPHDIGLDLRQYLSLSLRNLFFKLKEGSRTPDSNFVCIQDRQLTHILNITFHSTSRYTNKRFFKTFLIIRSLGSSILTILRIARDTQPPAYSKDGKLSDDSDNYGPIGIIRLLQISLISILISLISLLISLIRLISLYLLESSELLDFIAKRKLSAADKLRPLAYSLFQFFN